MGVLRRWQAEAPVRLGLAVGPGGLQVADARVPLYSAGLPYPEIAPGYWDTALESVLATGFRMIRVDVPWYLHEPTPGVFEWGERCSELNLPRLLERARAHGLLVLVRPGPWLGLDHPHGGLPRRLLHSDGAGAPEPPLPVAAGFREAARVWLGAVARVVSPFTHPRGPVVGWIATTPRPPVERPGGGLLDRSPDSVALWRRHFGTRAPGRAVLDSPPAAGPERPDELDPALAWVEAGEVAARCALADQLAARPTASGPHAFDRLPLPGLAWLDDDPPGAGVAPPAAAADADGAWLVVPADAGDDYASLRLAGLRAAELGPAAGAALLPSLRTLYASPAPFDPPTAAAVLAMSGVRALDLQRVVHRRGAGEAAALLHADGTLDAPVAARWRELLRMLDAISHAELRRETRALLLINREVACLRESCRLPIPLPADLAPARVRTALATRPRDLGLRDRPELEADAVFDGLFEGLRRAAIPFSVADTTLAAERLSRERLVFVPSFERMSRETAQALFEWALSGGTLVIGPRLPRADWAFGPLDVSVHAEIKEQLSVVRFGRLELSEVDLLAGGEPLVECEAGTLAAAYRYGRGRVALFGFRLPWGASRRDPGAVAAIARGLARAADVGPRYAASDPEVETELHEGIERRFLFLANASDEERRVSIELAPREALREVRGRGTHVRAGETLAVPARSVILREVVRL